MDTSEAKANSSTASAAGAASSSAQLEQFVILAKTTKGAAVKSLIEQAVGTPGLYVFGELLSCPNVKALETTDDGVKHWRLLNLFAFGTYSDYVANKDQLPPLTDYMLLKLRQLTVLSLASKERRLPYPMLLDLLHLENVRQLEDLIIDASYRNIIVDGKLDQRNQCLLVENCKARDVRLEQLPVYIDTLRQWAKTCERLLGDIETEMQRADQMKAARLAEQKRIDDEVANIKKTLKTTARSQTPDFEEPIEVSSSRSVGSAKAKQQAANQQSKEAKRHKQALRGSAAGKGLSSFFK